MKTNKIQALLINHLMKHGTIQLKLPDNVVLEIGITAEDKEGNIKKTEDYCWVIAAKESRAACLDSYNLGIRFEDEKKIIVMEDNFIDCDGNNIRQLNVV
jgi:hypothetical protein